MTISGQNCRNCGHELAEGTAFCSRCGHHVVGTEGLVSSNGETYLALMTANVMRLRRQWELAEAKCSEVLQRDPRNAAACSVMGDIARDQGKLRDAIEWYKMALDHNPGSSSDRKKLESLIDQVFSAGREGAVHKAVDAVSHGVSDALAEVRIARPPKPLALVVGTVLLVIVLIALSTVLMGRKAGTLQPSEDHPAALVSPKMAPSSPKDRGQGGGGPRSREAAPDLLARETELRQRLEKDARETDPNCEVQQVEIDPRDASVDMHMTMLRLWSAPAMRKSILGEMSALASSAAEWDSRVSRVKQRYTLRGPGGAEEVVAVAEGSREQVVRLRGAGEDAEKVLQVWWAPELRE